MRTGTVGSGPGGGVCGHAVRVYDDEKELAGWVAAFLDVGLRRGEPGVVAATAGHRDGISAALEERGHDPERLAAEGRLAIADAEGLLASFLEGAGPSAPRFHTVVGRLLDRVQPREPATPVRVFGELVDLLVRRGRRDAALALEELWTGLVRRRGLRLLCGYRLDVFDVDDLRGILPAVYRAHERVEPPADAARLERAVDHALAEALGAVEAGRVRRLAGEARLDAHVPSAELALMWVSARMPAAAQHILASARAAYAAGVPARA